MTILENVSIGKQAWQSSYSKWSKEGESDRALAYDGKAAFSFHTEDDEQSPWWMVDLEDIYPIHSIVVGNRRDGYRNNIRTMVIEISRDGENWTPAYSGLLVWHDDHTFTFDNEIVARFVRLSLRESVYFHLAKVEIWTKKSPLKVVVNRLDGFGCRLEALLRGAYLAKVLNADFKVRWPVIGGPAAKFSGEQNVDGNAVLGHSIEDASDVFTPDFVAANVEDGPSAVATRVALANDHTAESLCRPKFQNEPGVVWAPGGFTGEFLDPLLAPDDAFGLPDVFQSLPFSKKMTEAINAANEIPLSDKKAALHIRSGDIVFGEYRKQGRRFLKKAVPLPLAKMAIEKLTKDGFQVVVFGEDMASLRALKKDYPRVVLASDLVDTGKFKGAAGALFDIVLMSRMNTIIAGDSGFARIARDISRTADLQDIHKIFDVPAMMQYFNKDIDKHHSRYHPRQTGFALWSLYCMAATRTMPAARIAILDRLSVMDPENLLYPVVKGCELLADGQEAKSDSLFSSFVFEGWEDGKKWGGNEASRVLSGNIGGKFHLRQFYDCFKNADDVNRPHILYVMAMLSDAVKDQDRAKALLQRAATLAPDNLFIAASLGSTVHT